MNIEPIRTINGIEFTIFGNEDIQNYSAFDKKTNGISIPELYDNQEPKKNGLIDPRMGSTNDNIICDTCNFNSKYCVGHFGHIKLESPVYHIGYFSYIKKILNCVCIKCSNLRFNKSEEEIAKILKNKVGKARLVEVINLTKETKYCSRNVNCGSPLPKIKQDAIKSQAKLDLIAEFDNIGDTTGKKKLKKKISPYECFNILKNISNEDCILLGLNPYKSRPENMIYQVLPVPPICIRPSVRVEGMSFIKDDDLTKQLTNIIKCNERILKNKDSFQKDNVQRLEDSEKLLQVSIAAYYDNDSQFMPKIEQKGKTIKSLTSRIKSKKGQIRSNLMGKRTDFSARSVISPDTCISINEVGVPLIVATTLTYLEYVTNSNIDKLTQYVMNGRDKYPGANYVIILNENGEYNHPIDLRFNKNKIELKVGDKVERHLLDGDMVLFNRYPTLHKYSMMGHRIKVIRDKKYATFRLNVGVTNPYNADYDGDEMQITVPRTIQSRIELEELADVKKLLINTQTSLPIYGCKIDAVTGAYLLTRDSDVKIPVNVVMNLLSYLEMPGDKEKYYKDIKQKNFYNGKELFSFIIPKKINIDDGRIIIKNGILSKGAITSDYISSGKSNSMVRLIFDLYNDEEARKFFDNVQKLTNQYNMWIGFTTSFKDITYSKDIRNTIDNLIKNIMLKVNVYTTKMENDPTLTTPEVFEDIVMNHLSNIRTESGQLIINNFKEDNNIKVIIESGSSSKVTPDTISKIIAIEAQHSSMGGRFKKMNGRRALPYFNRDLDTPAERGFNQHSLLYGLTYPEFVFNNITSREALINNQTKTADSGYVERKLVKSMEDFYVAYDGTVRNSSDVLIQFNYGDSNIDTIKQYQYLIKTLVEDDKQIKNKYIFTDEELKKFSKYNKKDNEKFYNELINMRNSIRNEQLKTRIEYTNFSELSKFLLPINIIKIKNNLIKSEKNNDLTPEYIVEQIYIFINHKNTNIIPTKNNADELTSFKIKDENIIKSALKLAIFEIFAPKRCIFEYNLNKETFDNVLNDLKLDIKRNIVEPGEMVGIKVGQSLCENITQANLRSHHLTGVKSKTAANSGTSRITEIFNNTKEIKTPRMTLRFDKNYQDKEFINQIKAYMKQTIMSEIRNDIEVYYDPDVEHKKSDNVENVFYQEKSNSDSCISNIDILPWLIKIKFNKEELLLKKIELIHILSQIYNMWENRFENIKKNKDYKLIFESIVKCGIASNNDNDIIPIIHIRFDMINYNLNILHNFIELIVDKIKIKGVKNIIENDVQIVNYTTFDNENHNIEVKKEHIIITAGINIESMRSIKHIDVNNSVINDIGKIYSIFGIEAARYAIIDELMQLTGYKVNYNHFSILVDYMTRDGFIISIDRNGLGKANASLFNKFTFEKPVEQLINAALFNETDDVNGVSARIATGRTIKGGTGLCNILFNTEMVINSEYIDDDKNIAEFIDVENKELINDIINNDNDDIFIPM